MQTHLTNSRILCMTLFYLLISGIAYSETATPESRSYIVGQGDRLSIQVWDHDDLNRTVEVSPNGTFSFPFIGNVQASGKSVFLLEKNLMEKLSDGYLISPQVTVSVSEYKNKKAFLFGEVIRPGSYILKKNMRLLEFISDAGGFTENRGSKCTVVRTTHINTISKPSDSVIDKGQEIIHINLVRLTSGDPKENILILPNDSIYIATVERVYVTGEVRRPGEINYSEGMTVRQAISKAGGGTPKAAISRIRIVRMSEGKESEITPQLGDSIYPNDILKVPESYF